MAAARAALVCAERDSCAAFSATVSALPAASPACVYTRQAAIRMRAFVRNLMHSCPKMPSETALHLEVQGIWQGSSVHAQ